MPKSKGDPYFISCRTGAEKAAADLDVDMIWDGPTQLDAAKQNEVVEGWITRRVDAISVSVENAASISTVLRKARSQGIKVVAWDADAKPDARDYFINQATTQAIGFTLLDEAARVMHEEGRTRHHYGRAECSQSKFVDLLHFGTSGEVSQHEAGLHSS